MKIPQLIFSYGSKTRDINTERSGQSRPSPDNEEGQGNSAEKTSKEIPLIGLITYGKNAGRRAGEGTTRPAIPLEKAWANYRPRIR